VSRLALGLVLAGALGGCAILRRPIGPVEPVAGWRAPSFDDDCDAGSARVALDRTLPAAVRRGNPAAAVAAERLREILALPDAHARRAAILSEFRVLRVRQPVLLTAYYEPELPARQTRDAVYRYPIYARPPDLVDVDPRLLPAGCHGCRALSGKIQGKRLVPYLTRAEIDAGALEGRGLELAYTDDLVSLFTLHIQGSGLIRLPDGSLRGVRFAGTNGRPFRGIARALVARGYLQPNHTSMADIRRALDALPESKRLQMLAVDERYTFFRIADGGPVGTLGVELTAGRSIATDPRWIPLGSVGYLVTPTYRRFVVSQDTGAAVTGAHADLFLGGGEQAETTAGRTRERGTLYLIVPR